MILAGLDRAGVEAAQDLRDPVLDLVLTALSSLWLRSVLLAAALLAVTVARRDVRPAIATALALAAAEACATFLKGVTNRPRPPIADHAIHTLGALPRSGSFPSGHATTAFAAAAALGVFAPRARPALVLVAAAIGLSRVWLGVHYPSDVVAGAVLGAALGLAAAYLTRWVLPGH